MPTDAEIAMSMIERLRDTFASMHYGIESLLRKRAGNPISSEETEGIATVCLDRCHGVCLEAVNAQPSQGMDVYELALEAGKALATDFLTRVDPVLNPDED